MSDNPYAAPTENAPAAKPARLTAMDYIGAVFSGIFVCVGVVFIFFGALFVLGRQAAGLSPWQLRGIFIAMLCVAPLLGGLSGWQAIHRSKRKLAESLEKQLSD